MSLAKFANWLLGAEQETISQAETFKEYHDEYKTQNLPEGEALERASMDWIADNIWESTIGLPKNLISNKITEKIGKLLPDSVLNDYYVDQFLGQFNDWYDNYTNKEETVEIMGTFFYEGFTQIGSEGLDYNPWTPAGSPVGIYPRAFYPDGENEKLTIKTGEQNLEATKDLLSRFSEIGLIGSLGELQTPTETYKIQEGDTVWGIAQKYGMTVDEVIALNLYDEINNPDGILTLDEISDDQSFILIKPGEKLQIIPDWATYLKGKDEDLFMGSLTSNFADAEALTITRPPVDPLILDLDGDGIETTTIGDGIYFDHETDGFAEKTSWTGNNNVIMFDKYYIKQTA